MAAEDEAADGAPDGAHDAAPDAAKEDGEADFTPADVKKLDQSSRLSSPIIYEILRREGDEEMARPLSSLWWSGVAAGLSLSLSLLAQAALQSHLPNAPWRELVASTGYSLGFLVAVMARHQLFTENTITPVLPVASQFSLGNLGRMGRLWAVVLAANFAGTFCAALFYGLTPVVSPEVKAAMLEIAGRAMAHAPGEMFVRAVAAGFIIAAMVWLLPSAGQSQGLVVILMTYLVAAAELAHIVAGSLEAFMLMLDGRLALATAVTGFALPVLAGNVIGGTALFALISYAQVAKEI